MNPPSPEHLNTRIPEHATPVPHQNPDSVRDRYIKEYQHLVGITAGKLPVPDSLRAMGYEVRDSIGQGYLGLIKAARDFDPARGVKFSTYAILRIKGAMIEGFRAFRREKRGQPPVSVLSLDGTVPRERHTTDRLSLADALPSGEESPLEHVLLLERWELLRAAIAQLPARERTVLTLYHFAHPPLTFKAIAERIGVSETRAFQLNKQALKRLQKALQEEMEDAHG